MEALRRGCLAVVASGAVACGGNGQPGHRFEVIEEDGIRIAVSSAVPKYDGELFSYQKGLVIRPDPGNDDSLLYRPFTFTMGEDGRYYVADTGNHRIAVFDAGGGFVGAFGREGDGPGELRSPRSLEVGDGVVSVLGSRTTRFRTDGTFIDVLSHPAGRSARRLDSGGLVVTGTTRGDRDEGNAYGARALVVDADGEVAATVETPRVRMETGLQYGGAPSIFVWRDRILATTGIEPTISYHDLDGRLVRQVRIELPPEPVTEADQAAVEALWDRRIEHARDGAEDIIPAEFLLDLKESTVYPDVKAHWERPIVEDGGWLWLPVPVPDTNLASIGTAPIESQQRFRIVDPRGEFIGTTAWPPDAIQRNGSTIVRGHLLTMVWDTAAGDVVPTVYRISPAVPGLIYP